MCSHHGREHAVVQKVECREQNLRSVDCDDVGKEGLLLVRLDDGIRRIVAES